MNPSSQSQRFEHHLLSAQSFSQASQTHQARAHWHAALSLFNESAAAHAALALSYTDTAQFDAAMNHAEHWSLLEPTNPQAHWLLAQLLRMSNHLSEAITHAERLYRLAPNWTGLNLFLAKLYLDTRQMSRATPFFEAALTETADNPDAHALVQWEYAMQLLTLSEYKRGWSYYNARLTHFNFAQLNLCPLPAPLWQGESLKGKTIVVHGEQGIGDEIMYTSILPDIIALSPQRIILAVYPALVSLLQTSFPEVTVIAHTRGMTDIQRWQKDIMPDWWHEQNSTSPVDYQIPMGHLPHLFRQSRIDYPKQPHIKTEAKRTEALLTALTQQAQAQSIDLNQKRLMALAWCGNLDNPHGQAKSLTLSQLSTLKDTVKKQNIVFVSLQNAQYGHEAQMQTELPIIDMSAYTEDFADTLAVACLCERVITIDTSYFHLCGAAGLPTWLLLREKCDWRNGWQRNDYDWYEHVELIRQQRDGDWSDVFAVLDNKLQQPPVNHLR